MDQAPGCRSERGTSRNGNPGGSKGEPISSRFSNISLFATKSATSSCVKMAADGKLKRKLKPAASAPNKKLKAHHLSANDLPWTTVPRAHEAGLDAGLDGIMELEEVDGIEVVYEDTDKGKVVKFNVSVVHSRRYSAITLS